MTEESIFLAGFILGALFVVLIQTFNKWAK
jgi:uncharacterized membrane protein